MIEFVTPSHTVTAIGQIEWTLNSDMNDVNAPTSDQEIAIVNVLHAEKIAAISAFHRWRHSQMRIKFKRNLESLSEDIHETENETELQKQELMELKESHSQNIFENERLRSDLQNALTQLETTMEELSTVRSESVLWERAATSASEEVKKLGSSHEAAMRGREEERKARVAESKSLQAEITKLLENQQQLIVQLSQRDAQVVELQAEAKRSNESIKGLEQLRLESRRAGERAAAAEASRDSSISSEASMRSELEALRVLYIKDLSELKAARICKDLVSSLRDQVHESQKISSSMVLARDDMRVSLDACSAQLVSAEDKCRRLASSVSLRDQLSRINVQGGTGPSSDTSALIDVLSSEMDNKTVEISSLAAKAASLNAILTQSQAQVERLSHEKSEISGLLELESGKRRQLELLVGELQAEMQRMASESSLPPLRPTPPSYSARDTAPISSAPLPAPLSRMETQATALRVLIATKVPSFKALDARLLNLLPNEPKSSPLGHTPHTLLQLEAIKRESKEVVTALEALSEALCSRPFQVQHLVESLLATRSTLEP